MTNYKSLILFFLIFGLIGLVTGCDNDDVEPDPKEDSNPKDNSEVGSYSSNYVHCGEPSKVVDVINPITGKTWMDRNLGASRAATSATDEEAYGDLYQWGRSSDGHQCRNSKIEPKVSSSVTPDHGDFILSYMNYGYNWHMPPKNDDLWQGVNGINNPCPSGYRLPTEAEFSAERRSWTTDNYAGAFASPLKLTLAGTRFYANGELQSVGTLGNYWSSTTTENFAKTLIFHNNNNKANIGGTSRAYGNSVRCIKD